ncbi:cytochrome c biogenesis protein [Natranaerobius thermophilus]|uniref:Cytochrome c assembly protein n=1 Tax=Natranaerobius thermophilus (strain ATCC BAA-1301 / DSM 18059 / JW/NM-WN-LF) TaxID=457570 RepID=B2A1G5_NATTJ|nr:cytochrome c biogenesis protein [Natranaerobius thermophilus]ACB84705.1 cytochrome c assembly protein [Natranaerobius thermophilus JW/NM-WN-LF]
MNPISIINLIIAISLLASTALFILSVKYLDQPGNNYQKAISQFLGDFGYLLLLSKFIGRSYALGYLSLFSFYETLILAAIVLVTVAKAAEKIYDVELLKFFSYPLSALFMIVSLFAPQNPPQLTSEMMGGWLGYHIAFVIIAYGCFSASFLTEGMYLFLDRCIKNKQITIIVKLIPSLDQLNKLNYRIIFTGFIFLTVGIGFGGIWSDEIWGAYWFWEPKFIVTLFIWLVYGIYLYNKLIWGFQGKVISYLNLIGFIAIMINYFVVRLLDGGLHHFY